MHFDLDRLSQLAGINTPRRSLNEAGNRSQGEDPGKPDDVDHRWGKNQLAERQGPAGTEEDDLVQYEDQDYWGEKHGEESDTGRGEDYIGENDWMVEQDDDWNDQLEGEEEEEEEEEVVIDENDVVLEIDEGMLRREISAMRDQRLHENKLRSAIRNEIQDIFSDLGISDRRTGTSGDSRASVSRNSSSGGWVYGDNRPTNSRKGFVNVMFPGIGFR